MALLEVQELVTGYGDVEIIHGVSLNIENNEIITVIGPNGAGKSTLLKGIFGIIDRWSGDIRFKNESIVEKETDQLSRMGMCYVPQRSNIFPNLSVKENLRMGAYTLDGVPEDTLNEVFDHFPILEDRKDQRADTMSGGQQQMLALARALMVDPDLMFIDEPSAGLAPDLMDDVFNKIENINESGTAIIMVEQNATEALRRSDRGFVLDMGEKRFTGTGEELLDNDDVIDLYLGSKQRT